MPMPTSTSIEELLNEIENCRHKMYSIAAKKDLSDPEVVSISKQLDELINRYNNIRLLKK